MTLDDIPFARLLGIEVESVEPGHAVLSMKIRDDLKRNHGIAHGGAVATPDRLGDGVCDYAAAW